MRGVGRIDDIIFYQITLWFNFVPLSESNNIYKYVPKNGHVFVISNGVMKIGGNDWLLLLQ